MPLLFIKKKFIYKYNKNNKIDKLIIVFLYNNKKIIIYLMRQYYNIK